MLLPHLLVLLLLTLFTSASQLKPAVLPLAVRNPYLSLWWNAREEPWKTWPMHWNGELKGLSIMARIASTGVVYPLLGRPHVSIVDHGGKHRIQEPTFLGFEYDACTTTLKYTVDDAEIELLFSSPITGDDELKQSLPASYIEVKAKTGKEKVQVYIDVNGMWVTGDSGHTKIKWSWSQQKDIQSWGITRNPQLLFTETRDQPEWGTFYLSAPRQPSISYAASPAVTSRNHFAKYGFLDNTNDPNFRPIFDNEPVFAFVKSFSRNSMSSVVFTLALVQDQVIQFASARGLTSMVPFYSQAFSTDLELLAYHYDDYSVASAIAANYSANLRSEASSLVSETYADIVSLSARQVLGACIFTGTPRAPLIFMKEISSDGNVNTVDVIFPSMPFFLYTNPKWLGYLLEPLLEHQEAGLYPNRYSIHDLGASFPNATGHPDGRDEPMPVEECGNMLIMALAYAQALPDNATAAGWLAPRYPLWKQWTSYLVDYGLIPDYQLSTDDFAGRLANQTNLALKAIVGIHAMSHISALTSHTHDAETYHNTSISFLPTWHSLGLDRTGTHMKLAYHWQGSWGSLYNAYPAALLCFPSLLPKSVYHIQSKWYSAVHQRYGVPLDSRHLYTKSDWEMWIAAIAERGVRKQIVGLMGDWVEKTTTDRPFTDLYESEDGGWPGPRFMARPVVGGHFASLALASAACKWEETMERVLMEDEGRRRLVAQDL